ncbi:MAG: cytochrome c [Phycisphaerales bacterium]|nr:cytochrome c [Phycisphaerales bacterium]
MPRLIVYSLSILALLALVPPMVLARNRGEASATTGVHIIFDMDLQTKFKTQAVNPLFADGRSMRQPVAGTVARGDERLDTHYYNGVVAGQWATTLPAQATMSLKLLERGQARFNIYCSACHGYAGAGDGMVNQRALALVSNAQGPVDGTVWVTAKSLHDATVTVQPIGQLFNTITYGIRNMAGYGTQIPVEDRWAIAAYVKALQRSQDAAVQDVPPQMRAGLGL